ncbi:MAG: hypothetical protein WCD53_24270, partial [Microcoleus sp.]
VPFVGLLVTAKAGKALETNSKAQKQTVIKERTKRLIGRLKLIKDIENLSLFMIFHRAGLLVKTRANPAQS